MRSASSKTCERREWRLVSSPWHDGTESRRSWTHLGEAAHARDDAVEPLAALAGEVGHLVEAERLELGRVAELVLDEVLGRLGLVLDRLVRLADLLELGVKLLDDLRARGRWSMVSSSTKGGKERARTEGRTLIRSSPT